MKKVTVFLIIAISIYSLSFTWNGQSERSDSELTLLMRAMFDEAVKVKEAVMKGKTPRMRVDIEKIHTAQATVPEKTATDRYKSAAVSYIEAVKAFKQSNAENVKANYTGMVDACVNCHRTVCPGPVVKIKKLYF